MNPAVSIIMPCHERALFLHSVLKAYDKQQGTIPFEIIAVDDGSKDSTPELLTSYYSERFELRPLLLPKNGGPANARNHGIAEARASLVMFVGDDIMPSPTFIQEHVNSHIRNPDERFAILGKTVWPSDLLQNTLMRHIDGLGAQQFSYYYMRDGQHMDYRHFYTSNISLKRSLLQKLHPWFDTGYRYAAFEDVDLGYRLANQAGMDIIYTEHALAEHYHYYNIWGFTERQYRAGLMSAVFVHKYPHLRRQLQFLRVRIYIAMARIPDVSAIIQRIDDDELYEIENLALHIASYYEIDNVQPLDRLYLLMLNYYVLKGMIDGDAPEAEAMQAKKALLIVSYAHHIREIMKTIKSQNLDYPQEVYLSFEAIFQKLHLPLISAGRKLWATSYANIFRSILGPGYSS